MVDSMNIYKSLNINTGTIMKNPEMLKFVPGHLKTKKLCKHTVKKLLYLLKYVLDQCKTQQICDKAINRFDCLHLIFVFDSIPNLYKIHEMCNSIISRKWWNIRACS